MYKYIIHKEEFTSLIAFGKTPLIQYRLIDQEVTGVYDLNDVVISIFQQLPVFRGDESYLILDISPIESDTLSIYDILEINCLTKAAMLSYESKFSKVKFNDSLEVGIFDNIKKLHLVKNHQLGIETFCKLSKIKLNVNLLSQELISTFLSYRLDGTRSDQTEQDLLVHILIYDRYDYFPKTNWGYFYDSASVFLHSEGRSLSEKSIEKFLNQYDTRKSNEELLPLIEFFVKQKETKKIIELTTTNGVCLFIVATIYFFIKNEISEKTTLKKSKSAILIRDMKKEEFFVEELNLSIHLIGLFFGYDKFSSLLYDQMPPKIYKAYKPAPLIKEKDKVERLEKKPSSISPKGLVSSKDEKLDGEIDKPQNPENIEEVTKGNGDIKSKDKNTVIPGEIIELNPNLEEEEEEEEEEEGTEVGGHSEEDIPPEEGAKKEDKIKFETSSKVDEVDGIKPAEKLKEIYDAKGMESIILNDNKKSENEDPLLAKLIELINNSPNKKIYLKGEHLKQIKGSAKLILDKSQISKDPLFKYIQDKYSSELTIGKGYKIEKTIFNNKAI